MAVQVCDLYAVRPICSLCCCAFRAEMPCFHLDCSHLFCKCCLRGLARSDTSFLCPYDGTRGLAYSFDQQYIDAVEAILANSAGYSDPTYQQYLINVFTTLQSCINFTSVPCRAYMKTGNCPNVSRYCYYDHQGNALATQCPLGPTCNRITFCPYLHSPPPAPSMHVRNHSQPPASTLDFQIEADLPTSSKHRPGYASASEDLPQASNLAVRPATSVDTSRHPQPANFASSPTLPEATFIEMPSTADHPTAIRQTLDQADSLAESPPFQYRFQYHRMPKWYSQQAAGPAALVDLPTTDKHYKEIETLFNHTSASKATIVKIERIQNKHLYMLFAHKHETLSEVEGRTLQLMHLFHGTRKYPPPEVYDSLIGLDPRLGDGAWGRGVYCASNSAYSVERYGHKLPDGTQQIVCMLVLVGDIADMPASQATEKLVRPPLKPGTNSLFHCVKGEEGDSDIYVTYDSNMCYPQYLITFR